jgi:AMMECR1 domain-containing protein
MPTPAILPGDKSRVVGYSADLFVKSARGLRTTPFSLTERGKGELLALARKSVEYMGVNKEPYAPTRAGERDAESGARRVCDAHRRRALRGCIGYTSAIKPLYMTVRDTATLAALRDPRFRR